MSENKSATGRRRQKAAKNKPKKRRSTGRKSPGKPSAKSRIQKLKDQYLPARYLYMGLLVVMVLTLVYVIYLDVQVRERFEGRLWAVPSKVYARALELRPNMVLNPDSFEQELKLMAYEHVKQFPQRAGQYRRWGNYFELISRSFIDSDQSTPSFSIRLEIENNKLVNLEHLFKPEALDYVRLDPALIGSIFPKQSEDRLLLKLDEVPERLIKTLIAVEDRSFYDHFGIDPLAILRALAVNIKAGEKRQGGSTLTQQLVKNLFLSSERSYWRKLNEAIMAVLLEWHYDKKSILEAYINEVYLGQNKQTSIHGFELSSHFYFNKPLNKLSTEQGALLIGMIKGPSYYNPRRHPKRAIERRNLVLEVMREQGVISPLHYKKSIQRPLAVTTARSLAGVRFPAFMDLIKRQLRSRFSADILMQEGLQIYSTLDPQVQIAAETSVQQSLTQIQHRAHDVPVQAAMIVTDTATAEVLALIGDRDVTYHGFNRALDASRQIGSLIKPAIYLAALNSAEYGENNFHLSSVLSDTTLSLKFRNGDIWQPQNYDHQFRGDVILHDALVYSYNVPSVRLGLKIGLEEIVNTLRNLGLQKEVPIYPSMLLGAFELTPYEVATMYQTIAADGLQEGLHAIRSVLSHQQKPLVYYDEKPNYTINESVMFLLKTALHDVTQSGTAKSLSTIDTKFAGKTGTTDDLRDSWFAGYSGDKLGVVWVGNDDNLETGLTGASGALQLWSNLFKRIPVRSIDLQPTEEIEFHRVDRKTGLFAGFGCDNTVTLPFLKQQQPDKYAECE